MITRKFAFVNQLIGFRKILLFSCRFGMLVLATWDIRSENPKRAPARLLRLLHLHYKEMHLPRKWRTGKPTRNEHTWGFLSNYAAE
jgi:hypothetical protein